MSAFKFQEWLDRRCLDKRVEEVFRATEPLAALLLRARYNSVQLHVQLSLPDRNQDPVFPVEDVLKALRKQLPKQLVTEYDYHDQLLVLQAAANALDAKSEGRQTGLKHDSSVDEG